MEQWKHHAGDYVYLLHDEAKVAYLYLIFADGGLMMVRFHNGRCEEFKGLEQWRMMRDMHLSIIKKQLYRGNVIQ